MSSSSLSLAIPQINEGCASREVFDIARRWRFRGPSSISISTGERFDIAALTAVVEDG